MNSLLKKLNLKRLKKLPHSRKCGTSSVWRFLRNRKGLVIGLGVILFLLPVVYFVGLRPRGAEAGWFNDDWLYRKPIAITNAGSDQTDFQVKILTNYDMSADVTAGKVQSDFDDLRFTDINGKLLPYWIEDNTSSSLDIWARMPSVPASGATVYMYYGNPSAPSASSVTNTFIREVSDLEGFYDHEINESYPESGATLYDLSGNDRDFSHSGTPSWTEADGFYFNNNGYFTGPSSSVFPQGSSPRTVIATAKPTSHPANYNHLFHYGTTSTYQSFGITSRQTSGNIGSHTWASSCDKVEWTDDTFNDVAITGSGSAQEIFKNGSSLGSCNSYTLNTGGGSSSQIGTRISPLEHWFGYIKNVQIYSRVLTSDEISDLHNERPYATENYSGKTLVRKYTSTEPSAGTPGTEEESEGPVAYWKFDEGYGTTVNDSTKNNNDLSFTSSPTWTTEDMCISSKCLNFDSDSDYASFSNTSTSPINFGSSDFSVVTWVKVFRPVTHGSGLFGRYAHNTDYNGNFVVGISDNLTSLFFHHRNTSGEYQSYSYTYTDYFGKWVHMAWVKSSSNLLLYLNGKLKQTYTPSISFDVDFTDDPYFISSTGWSPGTMSNLHIDEHRLYGYARTAAQIKTDYNAGLASGAGVVLGTSSGQGDFLSEGLVGYWKMDANVGTTIPDYSGNNNTGTFGTGSSAPGWTSGMYGVGLSFGGNDYALAETADFRSSDSQGTISAWIKLSTTGSYYVIFSSADYASSNRYFELFVRSDSKVAFAQWDADGGSDTHIYGDTVLSAGSWYQVAITSSGSAYKLYVNGSEESLTVQTGSNNGDWFSDTNNRDNWSIGVLKYNSTLINFMYGLVDETRIYNRALSPKEVRDLYNWAPGPVAHWKMDEKTGTSAYDTSGNGNTGTLGTGNSAPSWSTGKFGGGLEFDGSNDYASAANNSSLRFDGSNALTISLWFNAAETNFPATNGERLVSNFDGSSDGTDDGQFLFDLAERSSQNRIRFYLFDEDDTNILAEYPYDFVAKTWYHATAVFDSGTAKIYLNGVEQDSSSGGNWGYSGNDIYLGTDEGSTARMSDSFFNGLIDDVRIYNYARTAKQIVQDMNAGHPAVGSPVGSAVAHWRMDEGYGTTINNVGNGGVGLSGVFGTGSSAPSWTNDGKYGKALSFDGINDYVNVADSPSLRPPLLSLSAWIKLNALGVKQTVIFKEALANSGGWVSYSIQILTDNTVNFRIMNRSALAYANWATTKTLESGKWYYITAIFREITGASTDGEIYINSVEEATTFTQYQYTGGFVIEYNVLDVNIGAFHYKFGGNDYMTDFLNGLIDDVKIYNYALTEDEVKLDYNQGKAMVLGSLSVNTGNTAPYNAASQEYCIPGDTAACASPVLGLKMDEKTGTSAYDTSENSNTGTLTNSPEWQSLAYCHEGGCLNFDNNSDHVVVSDDNSLDLTTNGTIEMWFSLDTSISDGSNDDQIHIFDKGGGYFYFSNSSSKLVYFMTDGVTMAYSDSGTWNAGDWHQVVVSNDGTTLKMYIDGVLQSITGSSSGKTFLDSNGNVFIGSDSTPDGNSDFDGKIDHVKIFDYTRTAAQIAWDYNRGGPIGWWKLDACQGTTAYDSSGVGNTGNISIGGSGSQTTAGSCGVGNTAAAWSNGASGKYSASLNFDGTDDYVNIAGLTWPELAFSVSWWHNPSAIAMDNAISGGAGWNTFVFHTASGGSVYVGTDTGTRFTPSDLPANTIVTGQWQHFVYTHDGTQGRFYKNGFLKAGPKNQTAPIAGTGFSISNNTGSAINGQADDFRIYNYALTATQVKGLYNYGAVNFGN